MTSVKLPTVYEDHLTYPILVKMGGGGYQIREMLGSVVNRYNGTPSEKLKSLQTDCAIKDMVDNWFYLNDSIFKWGTFSGLDVKAELALMIRNLVKEINDVPSKT